MADSREVAQRYADLFMQRFNEIDSNSWKKPWISSTASPMNIKGREYRRSNRLLLAFLCEKMDWKLPVFMTWQQASKLDVCVQKGQKSFPVVWFREWYEKDGKKISEDDHRKFPRDEWKEWIRKYSMSYNNVFNIAQTDFQDKRPKQYAKLQDAINGSVKTTVEFSCKAFDEAFDNGEWLCPITRNDGDKEYYSPSEDRIVVPDKERFPDQRDFYGTLAHEMVHSTGTEQRLSRDMTGFFGTESYAREELVAELGSAILSSTTGIQSSIREDNLQYLKSWSQAISDDPGVITRAVSDAAAADDLIDKTLRLTQRIANELNMNEIIPDLNVLETPSQDSRTQTQDQQRTHSRSL